MEILGAGWGIGGALEVGAAHALAANVEMPGKQILWLRAVDALERIEHARAFADDRQANLDAPLTFPAMDGDLCAAGPLQAAAFAAIPVEHGAGGIDGDLVVAARGRLDKQAHVIAVEQLRIV